MLMNTDWETDDFATTAQVERPESAALSIRIKESP